MKLEAALVLTAFLPALAATSLAAASDSEAGKPDLSGPLSRADLEKPGYAWMKDGEAKAKAELARQAPAVKEVAKGLGATDVEIYLGTWCGDSHDHVPTFNALLDEAKRAGKVEPRSVKYFALDRKKTYAGFANERKIEKLPTFVFLRDGKEIGRIIETPKESILADTSSIVSGK